MPEYTLIYFEGMGRAEIARWICAYGNIAYTDERVNKEDWPEKKKSVCGGKVPVLIVDDKTLPQSVAIARYLAKEAGLVPACNLEAAFCDAACDTISELMGEFYKIKFSGENVDEKFKNEFVPNSMAPVLKCLNEKFATHEWFVSSISWADLAIGHFFSYVAKAIPGLLDAYPNLSKHVDKVCALPKIKEWIDNRPDTPF